MAPTGSAASLNIRVADIDAVYREWRGRGAQFLALAGALERHASAAKAGLAQVRA